VQLTGTAHLSPGVTTLPKATRYTFTGSLSLCSGAVSASGAGNLGCSEGSSSGTATVAWSDGLATGVSFATHNVGSAVAVTGSATSGELAGENLTGLLNFLTTAVTACTTTGLSTLNFTGIIGVA
jgi:hypothetical protein